MSQNNYQSYDLMNFNEYPVSRLACSYCGDMYDDQTYVMIYLDNTSYEPQRICTHPLCLMTANNKAIAYCSGYGVNNQCTVCNTINTSRAIAILNCAESQYPFCLNNTRCHEMVIRIKNDKMNPA